MDKPVTNRDIMSKLSDPAPIPAWGKQRHQVKSRFYYLFWGAATVSVLAGQLYVGSGYRLYARSLMRIFDTIEVEVGREYNSKIYY